MIHAERNPFLKFGEYTGIYIGLEEEEDDPRTVDEIVSERLKKLLQGEMLPVAGISGKMAPWRREWEWLRTEHSAKTKASGDQRS